MSDLETRFGYVNIKSSPVHFYAQKQGGSRPNSVLTFEVERLNVGGAMKINTGVFTAPRNGTYHFSFSFMNFGSLAIGIRKNGVAIGAANTYASSTYILQSSLPATLKLKSGDSVDLFQMKDGGIYDDWNHYTHFTGWLIEEDLDEKHFSLPITTISAAKSADFLCQLNGFPKTCRDLRCRGHITDGFYLVQSISTEKKIDTIYCEFGISSSTRTTNGGIFVFIAIVLMFRVV